MTAKETLEKYGLKTDVKSIKERMKNYGIYLGIIDHFYPELSHDSRELCADEIYEADISLLCELAEKGEELEEIKKRAEKKKAEIDESEKVLDDLHFTAQTRSFYRAIGMAKKGIIDFIIKGEGK